MSDEPTRIAIACQGGGSHTAFTAGVLGELLPNLEPEYEVVGLSGTSGGAACALLAWYGMVHPDHTPGALLSSFWEEMAASKPLHRVANTAIRWGLTLQRAGVPLPEISPAHSPAAKWGQQEFRELLKGHVDFDAISNLLDGSEPALFISAIDVRSGQFTIFRENALSADAILASAAEPHLFEAVEVDGHYYWDGLFSRNPPLENFVTADDVPNPDEIWLIKINPQERSTVPKTLEGIVDRRNELAGNLSMNAEANFIETVNGWIEQGYLPEKYTHTEIEHIRFDRELEWRTKLDRDPEFLRQLRRDGVQAARTFLEER